MVKYEYITVKKDDIVFVFVTRGRSKSFSIEEMEDFIENRYERTTDMSETGKAFEPTNMNIFMQDLKLGLNFCVSKYGVSKEDILATAKALLPHANLDVIIGPK